MRLPEWLRANGVSQVAFARRIGTSAASVTRYCGGNRMPRPAQLVAIDRETKGAVTANDFMPAKPPRPARKRRSPSTERPAA